MATVKIDKVVSSLPGTLEPDTIYAVRAGTGFDLYISDLTGTTAHPLNTADGSITSQTFFAEESAAVSSATNGGFQWSFGNGGQTPQNSGIAAQITGTIQTLGLEVGGTGTGFTVEIYVDGVSSGVTVTTDAGTSALADVSLAVSKGQLINFRTTASTGSSTSGRVSAFLVGSLPATGEVIAAGATDGQVPVFNAISGEYEPQTLQTGGTDEAAVAAIAAGSTLGLEQQLLAASGQVGFTVLAVPYTFYQGAEGPSANHKAQVTSLGAGNVMFVYANGDDFNSNTIQEGPVFLGDGEVYVIENLQAGSIITFSEGGYGFAQQRNGNDESPMPMMSYALAFKDTFCYAFRNSQTYAPGTGSAAQGFIHIVNGPLSGTVTLRDDNNNVVQGQQNIALAPWQYQRLYTSGNGEYRVTATNPVMCAINAEMDTTTPRFYDSRLVLPVTNDGISWPRSGFISALYNGTAITNYVNDLTNSGPSPTIIVNPGTPLDWDAGTTTGANDADYEPRGATRLRAAGLVTAYSGADSSGLEASPLCPVSTFTQRLALPLQIRLAGDGGNNGIGIASIYTGTARVYQWNSVTGEKELVSFTAPDGTPNVTEIPLIRRDGAAEFSATTEAHQLHPASAMITPNAAESTAAGGYLMTSDFTGGYIEVDVPCTVVFNSEQNQNGSTKVTFRGTSGASVVGIHSDDDEQLTYGITPEPIRAEITKGTDGLLYRRSITGGVETWIVA